MNQQLIEHLIELRDHYRAQQLESEQRKYHAAQQLAHVDALLVDEQESPSLVESLIELRHQYQQRVAECDRQAANLREQLMHVNALLADQLVQQYEYSASIQTAIISEDKNRSLAEATDFTDGKTSESGDRDEPESLEPENETDVLDRANDSVSQSKDKLLAADKARANLDASGSGQESLGEPEELTTLEGAAEATSSESETGEESRVNSQNLKRQGSALKTPLLPQFQHLTKLQAIEQVMREKTGSILQRDWIIHALYGEAGENDIKAERGRMRLSLKAGVKQGLWEEVPAQPGCYTKALALAAPDLVKKANRQQQGGRREPLPAENQPTLRMLAAYADLSLIDAVDLVVNDRAGQVLTTELVAIALYGKLSERELSEAKEIVARALWRGAEAKRWQHVPGKEGVYTLDLRLIELASSPISNKSKARMEDQEPLVVLPAYSDLSLTDAITAVLRERSGQVMTPEKVTKVLFGNLLGISEATARKKVGRALWDGASRNRWQRLRGANGRYTLEQQLLNS